MTAIGMPARFIIVGLVCAAAHNVIMIAADWWHIHYTLSSALSYVVVVGLGFALHVRYTFDQQPSLGAFGRYALGMAANYPLTLALLFVMCDVAGWPVVIAAPVATVLMMAWNFLASRWAIVRKPGAHEIGAPPPASSRRAIRFFGVPLGFRVPGRSLGPSLLHGSAMTDRSGDPGPLHVSAPSEACKDPGSARPRALPLVVPSGKSMN